MKERKEKRKNKDFQFQTFEINNFFLQDIREIRFILLITLALFFVKIIQTNNFSLIISTTIYEFLLFLAVFYIFKFVNDVLLINKTKKTKYYLWFYYPLLLILQTLFFLHSLFIDDMLKNQYGFLIKNLGVISFTFKNIIPVSSTLLFISCLLILLLINFKLPIYCEKMFSKKFFNNLLNKSSKTFYFIIILVFIALFVFIPLLVTNFTNPFSNTVKELVEQSSRETISFSQSDLTANDLKNLNKNDLIDFIGEKLALKKTDLASLTGKKKILLFVMEEMHTNHFNKTYKDLPKNNFFIMTRNNTHYYSNYYTPNQDSRTAVMDMFSSIFIPYESYAYDNWPELYENKIREKNNLINLLRNQGFETVYSIPSVDLPTVSNLYTWDKFIHIPEKEYSNYEKKYFCLHLLQYQRGCEDKVVLSQIKDEIRNSDKLFLFHEFVFGHDLKYNKGLGMSSLKYYNQFLTEIYNMLVEEGLYNDTVIIVVSDHGMKDPTTMNKISGYKLPYRIISSDFDYEDNSELSSHLDFVRILFKELGVLHKNDFKDITPSEKTDEVFIVGSTSSSIKGFVDSNNNYFLLKGNKIIDHNNMSLNDIENIFGKFLTYKSIYNDQ